jgi:hypothetical protein
VDGEAGPDDDDLVVDPGEGGGEGVERPADRLGLVARRDDDGEAGRVYLRVTPNCQVSFDSVA